jgi:hypothetical protein
VSDWIDLNALWQIVVVGLICGAGLPALFALGLKALSWGGQDRTPALAGADSDARAGVPGSPVALAAAGLCFAVVLAAIGWGIYLIVAGT